MKLFTQIDLLASEAVSRRMLDAARLKAAEARVQLMKTTGEQMCLTPGCTEPVVNNAVLTHCEQHLTQFEKQLLISDAEDTQMSYSDDHNEHSSVRELREIRANRRRELIREAERKKNEALLRAQALIQEEQVLREERDRLLPKSLLERIQRTYDILTQ